MSKNTVYMISVGSKPEYDISIESWRRWCDKNDVQLFLLQEPILPMEEMHIIWQRYFMFDVFDNNEIDSNQTLLVDADTIIHPECDNFFDKTENKYTMVHDDGSYDWILRGMEHYKKYVYGDLWFDFWKYGNSGFQIVNNNHREFFKYMRDFYSEHKDTIQYIQKSYGIGTDQTPLNFNLTFNKISVKLLPYKYNMSCMLKKEILSEDMLHTTFKGVMHFNGLPDKQKSVPFWMEKTFNYLYD